MQKIFRAGMPRLLAVLALIFLIPPVVFGGGRKQKIQTQTAEGAGIWQTEFDVSSLKKGTYNFIVNAKDAAGNVGVSGPFNIRIDPNAGLPETRIVYPEEGMVMRNDFNIVGVAAARYGLKQVLIKIDNGEFLPMEGLDYWHYPFSFEEFSEGKHTIYAKAIDLNDMEGPVFKTEFYFDIVPPEFELTSHQIGDLIAGTVKIKGTVYDSLGIKSLHISDDNVHFTKLRHSSIRNDPARQFQFTIPSKKHTDGAMVYYLRAVNNTGFSVTKPFLFFVNNHPPEIEILSPEPDENSFGMTQVTGKVISGVGLTEFYYEWGGERFDITLRPGDPFWTAHVHFSLTNNRPVPFKITAVDKSGNVSSVTHRLKDTRRNRTPAFEIDYPLPNVGTINLEYDQPLYGHILPGFFPQSIMIEGAIDLVEAQPGFRIPPSLLPAGRSTVRMWAIAEDGTTSDQGISVRVNRAPPPSGFEWQESPITVFSPDKYYKEGGIAQVPVYDSDFNIIGFEEGTSTEEFAPWYADSFDLNGMIDGYRGNQKLEYRLRWDDTWKPISVDSSGEFNTTVSIAHLPDGPVPMELRTITDGSPQYPLFWPVNKYSEQPSVTFLTPNKTFGPVSRSSTTSGWVDYTVPLEEISFSTDGEYFEPTEFTAKYGRAWFNGLFDFPAIKQANRELVIRVTDRAGNVVEASPDYEFDNSNSAPVVFLNTPTGELITGDFDISGLAYVDVGIDAVYWRILSPRNPWDSYETTFARRNNTEYEKMEVEQNFHVQLGLDDVKDGINILEIFAEDIYGMQSKEVIRRPFNVSTAPPDLAFISPTMDLWNRGNITVNGTAFDLNGLSEVLVSMDNGVSYQQADIVSSQSEASEWSIALNTKAYSDGVYSMLVRATDNFGVASFSSGIINIDNTAPYIELDSPRNGESYGTTLKISGQIEENFSLQNISMQLVNIEDPNVQSSLELTGQAVVMEEMDVSPFPDGDYLLKVSAFDNAGNETSVIRNFMLLKARAASEIVLVNPLPGIDHSGPVIVSGRITGAVVPPQVNLMLDGREFTNIDVNRYGIFSYEMPEDSLRLDQENVFSASFDTPSGERIYSFENPVFIQQHGPVLMIDSHKDGDVITQRPWLNGRAFYGQPEEDAEALTLEKNSRLKLKSVEVSLDNGRSFKPAKGRGKWKFRLETSELKPGTLPVVIKASFSDNTVAVRRLLLTVDTRSPAVNTIGPAENSSHRDSVAIYGSAADDFDMDSVEVTLRPGNKAAYSVPGFIQGLYLDVSFLGGLSYAMGLGLTFFDDNVKVQINAAQASPGTRYSGWAFGGKVLANIFTMNLSRWFGPDWEFWKTSITLGAHFSYFLMEEGETPLWMGQFVGQWEIIKADLSYLFPKWKYFKSISLYTEPGIWFAPSDVVSAQAWRTKFTIAFGVRLSLF